MSNELEYEYLADRILRFPKALADFNYVELVDKAATGAWEKNYSSVDEEGPTRLEFDYKYTTNAPEWANYHHVTNLAINIYCNKVLNLSREIDASSSDIVEDFIHFSKWKVNGGIEPHSDEDYSEDNGIYTIIWYLNDNYEGGELGFPDQNIELKAAEGDIFIYPSYFIHYAKPVVSGFKYIAIQRDRLQ